MAGFESIMKAARFLPASVAVKTLQKFNPKFKNYFANAAAYGFDINNALDYLNERFNDEQGFPQQLEKGAAAGQLRPDEQISRNALQNAAMPGKIAKGIASFGAGALLGGVPGAITGAASEAIPQQQPEEELPGLRPQQGPQPQSPREQAIRRHAEMTKKKKLIDQLAEEFEKAYGQGNLPTTGVLGTTQGSNASQNANQGTSGAATNLNFKGFFSGLAGNMSADFYNKAYEALKQGKTKIAGIEEPILKAAMPYYKNGEIDSPEDVKDFYEKYYVQRKNQQIAGTRIEQGTSGGDKDQVLRAIQQVNQILGG